MASRSSRGWGLGAGSWGWGWRPSKLGPYVIAALGPYVVAALLAVPLAAQQPDRARTEALSRRAAERLQALRREADQLASQEQTVLGDLRKLEVERQLRAEEFKQADAQVQGVAADLTTTTARMRELEEKDLAERPGLRARIVEIYKLGQGRYLRLLLSTADLRSVGQASRTVGALAELDRRRIAEHRRTLAALQATRAQLDTRQHALEKVRGEAQHAQAAADRAAQARDAMIRDIDQRRDLNAQLAGELQAVQQKLQGALHDLAGGTTGSTPPAADAALPLRPFRGDLPWPASGALRRRFAATASARAGASNGIEIAAPEGAPALAVHEGVVAFADRFAGFGNLVIVDHGAQAFSLYGNLLEIAVKKGARIDRGQTLGSVGPSPTGPAGLYFELRVDGQAVDPLQWLKRK
jgi:septal ring factor EnvC (AmiA/AmiB activator)